MVPDEHGGRPDRHRSRQRAQYGNFSGWDEYRAHTQLLALLEPRIAGDFAQSLLNLSRQNDGVWDRWVHVNGSTRIMTGDPSAPTLAGIHALGVRNFEVGAALTSLVRQATVPNANGLSDYGCPGQCSGMRPDLAEYLRLHYEPQDSCHCWGGAAETLEDSTDDYGLADWARRLGRDDVAATFTDRARWWENTFNPDATAQGGYQQARKRRRLVGGAVQPGDRRRVRPGHVCDVHLDGAARRVPARRAGGRAHPGGRSPGPVLPGRRRHLEHRGRPAALRPDQRAWHPHPWLYNELGQPWKTQRTVRAYMRLVYGTSPDGLPGNDELGTMSAWYIWSALGMYPQTPSRGDVLLSSPTFQKAWIRRHGGPTITVSAPWASARDIYVRGVSVDGRASTRSWVPASVLNRGATVTVQVGDTPDRAWGAGAHDLPVDHGMHQLDVPN